MIYVTKALLKRLSVVVIAFSLVGIVGWWESHPIHSVSLATVSVTLSNPRLSFRGGLASGNSASSTVITINTTTGTYPSASSAQLVQDDTVLIGEDGSLGSYTVASSSSNSTFTITAGLSSGDADSGDDVISTQSATHTVRFTTTNAVANGRFRILVPALANDGAASDGIPDGGYFDFGTSAPTVTCPSNATTTYDFVSGTATASAQTVDGTDYHVFECAYSGTGATGTAFNGSSNEAITITPLINPAPKSNHTTGIADSHQVIIQHLDSSFMVQDMTAVSIGVIEAVKITATVPAQITFQVLGLAAGISACGVTTDVTTTATAVPFGEVSLTTFNDAAHSLSISTNAINGFSVTATENDQLGLNGGACSGDPTITSNTNCIADARGDTGTMADATSDEWNSSNNKGFAYGLHDVNSSTTEAFAYNESSRTFSARQFADSENGGSAQTIFSSTGPADNHSLYVCYRLMPGLTTTAGTYENQLTYTATATF